MKKRVVFVQPVLAPYSIPRYEALGQVPELEVHVVLEAESFSERIGWVPKEIPNCSIHVTKSITRQKHVHDRELGYSEDYTKAIPFGLPFTILHLNPDAVILCNPTQLLFSLPVRIFKRLKLGLILEDTPASQAKRSITVQALRKTIYRQLDFVFCFSQEATRYAKALKLGARQYRSSWSIDPDWLSFPRENGSGDSTLQFLYVGQLIDRKGILPMLQAWKRFADGREEMNLVLIGNGPLGDQVRIYCEENNLTNVHRKGHVAHERVRKYYLSSDVFILPTLEDIFGLVVTEAMAFGLPVLTTVYCGARELVRDGHNGYIFDPTSIDSIVDAFQRISDCRGNLAQMGQQSRTIIADYTHEKVMQRMGEDLIKELGRDA